MVSVLLFQALFSFHFFCSRKYFCDEHCCLLLSILPTLPSIPEQLPCRSDGTDPTPSTGGGLLASANQHDPTSCHKDGLLGGQELKANRKTDTNKKTPGQSIPPDIGFGSGVGWARTSAG